MSTQNDKLDFSQPEPDKNSMSFYADQQRNKLFARNDYKFVLVAFDDENGKSINSEFIDDGRLIQFNRGQNR